MAIGISWNIDIRRSLNPRDSFHRKKFENRAPISCPILWLPTISFELCAKVAEKIDLEKCNFRNFGSSVTLTLNLDRVEVTLVLISGRGLPTHQIRWKSEKLFVDVRRTDWWMDVRMNTREFQSTRSSPGNDLKIKSWDTNNNNNVHWQSTCWTCYTKFKSAIYSTHAMPNYLYIFCWQQSGK